MTGNILEQEIIEIYSTNISSSYSINQIATKLGKKYPYINKKVTLLLKNQIFKKIVVGRSHLCSLNLDNDETIYLLILNEIQKKKSFAKNNLTVCDYTTKICKASKFTLAIKTHNKIIFVSEETDEKIKQQNDDEKIISQTLKHLEPIFTSKDQFLQMLANDVIITLI